MAFRQIKTPALADQAVITAKLDVTAVSGHSAVTSLINADEFLVHDSARPFVSIGSMTPMESTRS